MVDKRAVEGTGKPRAGGRSAPGPGWATGSLRGATTWLTICETFTVVTGVEGGELQSSNDFLHSSGLHPISY